MKDAVSSVIEKITPENHDNQMSGENAGHTDSSEKEGGNDEEEEEERKPFIKHQTKLKPGDFAPFFEGVDQHGQLINLLSFRGKNIILYFYPKDDTPGCTAEACSLRDEQKYLADRNYAVVGVSADPQKSHAKFAAKYELNFPLLADVDLKIIKDYDVWGLKQFMGKIYDGILRTTFVIAPSGIITEVINEVDTKNHAQQILALDSEA
jgi:peroxiredoxin Q/BCP